jgi:hypothetical protein
VVNGDGTLCAGISDMEDENLTKTLPRSSLVVSSTDLNEKCISRFSLKLHNIPLKFARLLPALRHTDLVKANLSRRSQFT